MSARAVFAEVKRLAEVGRSGRDGALRIAQELRRFGARGVRCRMAHCPLARHLGTFSGGQPVLVTRTEVLVGTSRDARTLHLTRAPGDLIVISEFVRAFDDQPGRFRWLREGGSR
ncbi:hypothetical protein [Allonocardiopsis opalescens]|uniref:Uncharacterized protein n=1 Tax=Allonocardiopsis opalescens TaxID=1144618 RepID=A0A2T0PVN4_9ACTN|nr:hypothetical protein [Allonocardiopsis opalescens]PRX95606.1 hypothetical protein CLV72_109215 [Allonocardiopsis opalescens]